MDLEISDGSISETKHDIKTFEDVIREIRIFAGRDTSIKVVNFTLKGVVDITHNVFGSSVR